VSVIASDAADERTIEYETSDGERSVTYDDATYKLQLMNELAAVFFREFAGQTSRGSGFRASSSIFPKISKICSSTRSSRATAPVHSRGTPTTTASDTSILRQ